MRRTIVSCAVVTLAVFVLVPAALAGQEEFEHVNRIVSIAEGGTLTVKSFSGHVTITAADRRDVKIDAVRRATRERLNRIRLDIEADGGNVVIEANKRDDDGSERDDNVVETDFDIQVPRRVDLDVHVFSSDVQVIGVVGNLDVQSFSGELTLDGVVGPIDAETFSGDIEATLSPTARAEIWFNTFSGDIRADMPLTFESKSKRSLRATLNGADSVSSTLTFKTFSGDVRLLK